MSKKFLAIIFGSFIITFAAFFFVLNWGSQLSAPQSHIPNPVAPGPVVPKTPSVTFTILKSKGGNIFRVQWENLPGNTAKLNILRSTKGKDNWSLWKSITISIDQLGSGSVSFNIGNATFGNYSFQIEAVSNGTGTGSGPDNSGQTILWTSSSTTPIIETASSSQTISGTTTAPSSTPSSTTPGTSTTTSSSGNTSASSTTPQGTPYYTPQLQISGYSSGQTGAFWVQHVDQKIEIGWQNLPSNTTRIDVFRSSNQSGPWTIILTQLNPGVNGYYSIQVVDNTLGLPFYYQMNAESDGAVIATYGPVYLPPIGQ